ncbi:sugar transferase [Nesterenkonia muleiensis]|uniref:sugar transferase n=1 Tax=Nesterenkonia muleiensis TaxID=2282648 RepID=UPI00192E3B94|nr:sugar transferase [Nesterenkonia muleiensis]
MSTAPAAGAAPDQILGVPWNLGIPRVLGVVDAVAIALAVAAAHIIRFDGGETVEGADQVSYTVLSVVLAVTWWVVLWWRNSRSVRVFGAGTEEYKLVVSSTFVVFGVLAIASYLLVADIARGYVALALPIGVVLLLVFRLVVRKVIARRRQRGHYLRRVLIIGTPGSVSHLNRTFKDSAHAGFYPVAALLPGFPQKSPTGVELPIPVAPDGQDVDSIVAAAKEYAVDAVALTNGAVLSPRVVRQLGWRLHDLQISMILAPSLIDVSGPRIHTQPVAGLPLIHVSTPRISGGKALAKRSFDLVFSICGLVVLSPLLLVVAAAVKLTSSGPVLFRQSRVGLKERNFFMLKFRSMVHNAEELKDQLQPDDRDNEVLFKIRDDPRITAVGRFIRRTSIDELPQLLNVIRGDMSLVGPRPPLQAEVDAYEPHVRRRFIVQPGITGLWQVSGRSELSWDDSVRLDLYYVENWSLLQDVIIVLRTIKAVVRSHGAY